MLPKQSLSKLISSSLVVLTLSGCGGLRPTVCISSPQTKNLKCYDYKKKEPLIKLYPEIENWLCLSPVDFENVMEACKRGTAGPKVNQCVADPAFDQFLCWDSLTQTFDEVKIAQSENYVCVSPEDDKVFLDFCETLKTTTN